MERVLVLLTFLFSLSANAAVPTGVPQMSFGGANANTTNLTQSIPAGADVFTIYAPAYSGSTAFIPFLKNGAAYQVTTGKTFVATSISYRSSQAAVTGSGTPGVGYFQPVTATATFGIGATSVTGGVYYGTGAGSSGGWGGALAALVTYTEYMKFSFAATLWPGVYVHTSNPIQVWITGYEI